jgi:DNA excision repair protein ERCC-2
LPEPAESGGVAVDDGYMRFFPYDQPYENQGEAMERVYNALVRGQDVLFEGAPGTGKTLSALVPALEHARQTDRTVVITTNVHQQMQQFVTEGRAITRTEPIRAVTFQGKGSMCHLDVGYEECQVLRDNTYDLVDAERDREQLERRQEQLLEQMQDGDDDAAGARSAVMDELDAVEAELQELEDAATCEHYYNNLTRDVEGFYGWLYEDVRTPEEVYEYAHERTLCGYELLKDGVEGVDLVVCNYHHLLDPFVRDRFFAWLDRDPDDVVAVFDEAHNVADVAREHAQRTCTENTVEGALEELTEVEDPRADDAANVLEAFRAAMVVVREGADVRAGGGWEDVAVANDDRRDDLSLAFLRAYTGQGFDADLDAAAELGRELDRSYEEAYRNGETDTRRESAVLDAAEFLADYLDEADAAGRHPMVSVTRDDRTGDAYARAELYTCIPRQVTGDLFDRLHATVLMSATLRPFDVAGDVLGLDDPATMAYGLTFPEERRRTFAVDAPPLFASEREDPETQSVVGDTVADAVEYTPGNSLVFFPNYHEAERYHDRLADRLEGTVHLDEAGESVEDHREQLVAADGDALFTSLWGTLTEGVSFDGDDARTVVVVGVPYPHLGDRLEAVQDAYDAAFDAPGDHDAGWRYAVEIPTIRKTRQALGRVVRSPDDFGARVLVDRRYCRGAAADLGQYSVHDAFPADEREEMVDVDPGKLRFAMLNFFTDMDAYGGDPPAP